MKIKIKLSELIKDTEMRKIIRSALEIIDDFIGTVFCIDGDEITELVGVLSKKEKIFYEKHPLEDEGFYRYYIKLCSGVEFNLKFKSQIEDIEGVDFWLKTVLSFVENLYLLSNFDAMYIEDLIDYKEEFAQ